MLSRKSVYNQSGLRLRFASRCIINIKGQNGMQHTKQQGEAKFLLHFQSNANKLKFKGMVLESKENPTSVGK